MNPYQDTLETLLQGWAKATKSDPNSAKYLRSAFKLYVFEELGYDTRGMTTTQFCQFCSNLTTQKLIKRLKIELVGKEPSPSSSNPSEELVVVFDRSFAQAVEAGNTRPTTGKNYRSALGRFASWVAEQPCWQVFCPRDMPEVRPKPLGNRSKASSGKGKQPYSLKLDQLLEEQKQQISELRQFWTTGGSAEWLLLRRKRRAMGERDGRRPKVEEVSESTFDEYHVNHILAFWGYLHNVKGHELSTLSLKSVADSMLLEEYNEWLITVRECTHVTVIHLLTIAIAFCKQQFFEVVQRRNWSDIDQIEDLRALRSEFQEYYSKEKAANAE